MAGFANHTPVHVFYVETMAVDPSDIPGEEMSSSSSDDCSEVSVKYFLLLC